MVGGLGHQLFQTAAFLKYRRPKETVIVSFLGDIHIPKRANCLSSIFEIPEWIFFDNSKKGKLIFDGYPRTIEQAKNLDLLLTKSEQQIDFIFFLDVNKETIIKRIEKRKVEEKRGDDDLDTILKRYDTYLKTTSPVLDYYSSKQNFYKLDGNLEIAQINKQIVDFLKL